MVITNSSIAETNAIKDSKTPVTFNPSNKYNNGKTKSKPPTNLFSKRQLNHVS